MADDAIPPQSLRAGPPPHDRLLIYVPVYSEKSSAHPEHENLYRKWLKHVLELCAGRFGGATAYEGATGAWAPKGETEVHWDKVAVVEAYVSQEMPPEVWDKTMRYLVQQLRLMKEEMKQKEVAYAYNGRFLFV